MIIDCPYCHKKIYASNRQLIFSGRPNLVCPGCKHHLFAALRRRLQVMQAVMMVTAIVVCAALGGMVRSLGTVWKVLILLAALALILAVGELCARWISRPEMLRQATARMLEREKSEEEARRAAERRQKQHKKKKK